MDFARNRGGDTSAPRLAGPASQLLDAARQLETLDDDLARETYLEALAAAMYAGRLGEPGALANAAEAARAAVGPASELHQPMDLLLSGMANRIAGDVNGGRAVLRSTLEHICAQTNSQVLRWMSLAFPVVQETAAAELWDDAIYRQMANDIVRHARDAGALAIIPRALAYQARAHVLAGEFATAARIIEEAASITAATGHAPLKYDALLLTAWRGIPADAVGLIEAATAEGNTRGEGRLLGLAGYVTAVLYNGLGRYEEAFAAAREACEHEDLGFYGWCLIELIEAAVHTGEQATAAAAIRQLEERAGASGNRLGPGCFGECASPAGRRSTRRGSLHRSHRTLGAHQHRRASGSRSSALWGVAAPAEPAPRCASTPHRSPCDVHPDGCTRLRGAGPPRTDCHR